MCVFYVMQHARSACALLCHLRPILLYHIFPHYLTNFGNNLLNIKSVLVSSKTLVSNVSQSNFHICTVHPAIIKVFLLPTHAQENCFTRSIKIVIKNALTYRVSIKSFPDYQNLLQENYCTWNTNIHISKCKSRSFFTTH